MMLEIKEETLAKILWEVHSHRYNPFYGVNDDHEGLPYSFDWDMLEEKTTNPDDVDKEFFRGMAKHILERLA